MAPVLKTGRAQALVGSNPTPSARCRTFRLPANLTIVRRQPVYGSDPGYPPQRSVAKLTESVALRVPLVTLTTAVALASSG